MKILFLTTRLPFPPIGGECLRPFYFIKYLPPEWQVTLLTFVESEAENKGLVDSPFKNVRIRTVTLKRYESYVKCIKGFFSRDPMQIAYYLSDRMRKIVDEELRTGGYELIFCHLLRMAPYVAGFTGCKKVLDMSDALSLRYALSARLRGNHFKLIESFESKRLEEYEPRISSCFDLSLVASSLDKDYLQLRMGVRRLDVLENGVDFDDRREACEAGFNPKKIVFFGNLRTFHNIDAVLYFYKKIFPLVKKTVRDAEFVIAGANVPGCIMRLARDRSVRIFKDVPQMRPFVQDACCSIAPMRIAVGIQNKILQSMSFGVPVVATTLGLGGIGAAANREILLADTPEEFAGSVIRLMQNDLLRRDLSANACRLIKEKYLWPDIIKDLDRKLAALF